jgi:hypothetical protein
MPVISDPRRGPRDLSPELTESPLNRPPIVNFPSVDIPNVVPLRLGLFAIVVESRNVGLVPEVGLYLYDVS